MTEPSSIYRVARRLTAAALHVFYREIEVTGERHVEGDRPTILASNHPNSIVDPLVLSIFESRPIAFCARDGLFRIPGFGALLRAAGAIPLQRRSDHGDGADNSAAFGACRTCLADGGVLAIFPEGHTHGGIRVTPLKTGVARIALDAVEGGVDVRIVPVGLNFLVRQAFRSDVHVAFGTPIEIGRFREAYTADPRAAVKTLTEELEGSLRTLALHVERREDERLVAQVTHIVAAIRSRAGLDLDASPAERVALVRRILQAWRWYAAVEPDHFADLHRRLRWLTEERARLGLGGDSLALQHRTASRSVGQRLALLVAGAPLAAWGLLNAAVPYLALRALLQVLRPGPERLAWVKLVAGAPLFVAWYALITFRTSETLGWTTAGAYAVSVGPASIFALRWLTEARLHRVGAGTLWMLLRGDRMAALRAELEALSSELERIRSRFLLEVGDTGD